MAIVSKETALAALGGAVGGVVLWAGLYPIVKRQIESSVREQLSTQIPQQLTATLDAKMAEYGITPTTISTIARAVDLFGRIGGATTR